MRQAYRVNPAPHSNKKKRSLHYLSQSLKRLWAWIASIPKPTRLTISLQSILASLAVFGFIILVAISHYPHIIAQKIIQFQFANEKQVSAFISTANKNNLENKNNLTNITDKNSNIIINNQTSTSLNEKTITIQPNDNLNKIFRRLGLNTKNATTILSLANAKALRGIRPGQKISFYFSSSIPSPTASSSATPATTSTKQLEKLIYSISVTDTLIISKDEQGHFQAKIDHIEPIAHLEYTSLVITGSIYSAAKKNGIPRKLVAQFLNIFRDKVDLEKTLHAGDKIAILYNDYYVNGKKTDKNSEIVAAEYRHGEKNYKAIGFTEPSGRTNYYDLNGYALKSPFIRYPLNFKHISSPFSLRRYNPISHVFCEHTGVDLSANQGTPIKASSDGVIVSIGMDSGGYGNNILLKHNNQYSTLYAHMRNFAPGIHRGSFVHQNDIIGYVGMTGRATGPHLHYELRINGQPHDPVKTKLPSGELIAKAYRNQFFAQQKKLLAQMELFEHNVVAAASETKIINKTL